MRSLFAITLASALVALVWSSPPAQAADGPATIKAGADGVFALPAAAARLSGPSVRLDGDTAAHWSDRKDRAVWRLADVAAGSYDVHVTASVPEKSAGQTFIFEVDGETTIRGVLASTGGDSDFERRVFGRVLLTPGDHEVTFRPDRKVTGELAVLKQVELVPADRKPQAGEPAPFQPPPLAVPEGFEVELVAGPPLVAHPMFASFDDRGRLFVAESAGVNSRGSVLAENPPHEIRILEDRDGDGRFDTASVFADKLVFPQGILWHDDCAYVSSPPNFWRLRDTDGDGVADQRDVLVTGFANTGVADDMHGGSLGPDGRVYWCAGRFPHEIRRPGGPLIHKGTAPLILRCRPDGSDVEVVCGSQGNAVGVAFTDEGDCFASGTFLAPDAMGPGLRDALIHCVDGGQYPVRDRVITEHKRTGDLLPPLVHLGVSASSDLTICRGEAFGAEYRGNLFSALFNMHKVMRHVLDRDGATYRCRNEDFLVSTHPDFHPTDVLEDADGSLLVIDTGGWFIIGCPTSQIAKPQVEGAIYRVRKKGASIVADPRGQKIAWKSSPPADLVPLLDDARPAVRDRATRELAARNEASMPALPSALSGTSVRTRQNALWALARIDGEEARAAVRAALADGEPAVRQVAARVAGLHRDRAALPRLTEMAGDDTPPVRREAATALGRIGDVAAVPSLLAALRDVSDRFLDHAIIFAIIRLDDRGRTVAGLDDPVPAVRRGALVALDQMDHGALAREELARALDTDDASVQRAALEIIARRPGWADEITGLSREWLAEPELSAERQASLRGVLLAFLGQQPTQQLIAECLARADSPRWARLLLLETIGRGELATLPDAWRQPLVAALRSPDADVARLTVAAVAASSEPIGREELVALACDTSRPKELRVAAAGVVARTNLALPPEVFAILADQCRGDVEPVVRLAAARALGSARLTDGDRDKTVTLIAAAGPLELAALVGAFEDQSSPHAGHQLIRALQASPGLSALPAARLAKLLASFPPEVREAAEPLLRRLNVDASAQSARLAELESALAAGDAARGRGVFFGVRASCSACHRVGSEGGGIGPNLTAIGAIRSRRDLLEAVVFPSASFARGFEPVTVATHAGKVHSGIIGRETVDAIYLRTAERAEIRVPRAEIEQLAPAAVSIMPQGLDKTLAGEEIGDLIAFLASLRADATSGAQ